MNDVELLCFSMKLGKVGFTIVFEDNNITQSYLVNMNGLKTYKLNEAQFLEVSSLIFYSKTLLINTPIYLSHYYSPTKTLIISPTNNIYGKDWDNEEYYYFFKHMLDRSGIDTSYFIFKDGETLTSLIDSEGNLMIRQIKKFIENLMLK